MDLVYVLVINWNGLQWLKDCFETLSAVTVKDAQVRVLLVDNASSDGSVAYARQAFPWVEIYETGSNLGFAEGNNVAMQHAVEHGADYVLLLNNDTRVTPDFLGQMVKTARELPDIGIVGARVQELDLPDRIQEVGMGFDRLGYPVGRKEQISGNQPALCAFVSGCCMLITRKVLLDVGLFDTAYFAFAEDLDLCWRAWLYGYKVVVNPAAVIYHKSGGTLTGGSAGKAKVYETRVQRVYLRERNTMRTLIKNYALGNLLLFGAFYLAALFAEVLLFAFINRKVARADLEAVWWNLRHLSETLALRREVQAKRRVARDEVVPFSPGSVKLRLLLNSGIPKVRA